jgi:hypothetical protein
MKESRVLEGARSTGQGSTDTVSTQSGQSNPVKKGSVEPCRQPRRTPRVDISLRPGHLGGRKESAWKAGKEAQK